MYAIRSLAALALLISAPAFAYDPSCSEVVWSAEHGHYHCVGSEVRYEAPAPAPQVYVNLGYNSYPPYAYPYAPWYGPRFYARPVFVFGAPYHRHYWHHHGHWW